MFSGLDPSGYSGDTSGLVPFIDTDYFEFAYGDESAGERIIDSQYASSNLYVDGSIYSQLLFGVNFADGRIKGYGMSMPGGREKTFFVTCVRGNPAYGINDFVDNGDGTITDNATGLMWSRDDSGVDAPGGLNWEEALAWVEGLNAAAYLGHATGGCRTSRNCRASWTTTRSPATTGSAAIDPLFNATSIVNEGGQNGLPVLLEQHHPRTLSRWLERGLCVLRSGAGLHGLVLDGRPRSRSPAQRPQGRRSRRVPHRPRPPGGRDPHLQLRPGSPGRELRNEGDDDDDEILESTPESW